MKNKLIFPIILLVSMMHGKYAEAQGPSYLTANAVNVTHTPGSGVANNLFTIIEQRGLVPYKGRSCDDISESFTETEDGKKYGDNEYVSVHVHMQYYTQQAKSIFDQILQYNHPATELKKFETTSRNDAQGGNYRSLVNKETTDGRMVIQNDLLSCTESKYKEFHNIFFRSYAIIGTAIVVIDGSYNSDDESLAEKIHSEIVSNMRTIGNK